MTSPKRTSVAQVAHSVVFEAKNAVLGVLPDKVTLSGTVLAKKQLSNGTTILKLEDQKGQSSLDVFVSGNGDSLDDIETGQVVLVEGRCDIQADPQGATMRIIIRASAVRVAATTSSTSPSGRRGQTSRGGSAQSAAATRAVLTGRPFPRRIKRLAVVTSPGSAALGDIAKAVRSLGESPIGQLHECRLTGREAPASIAAAIVEARDSDADVILIVRGGDDGHHLSAFDAEEVLVAVDHARLVKPVVTGIGHADDTDMLEVNRRATHASATPGQAVHDTYRRSRNVRYRQNAVAAGVFACGLAAAYGAWAVL